MPDVAVAGAGTASEVFIAFLRLGLTSFGGPVAHLGYFRDELVVRRKWLDEGAFADLVALCQFLPGPASSQVGFALGLFRAGALGALAAFAAFTLPSALVMVLFGLGVGQFDGPMGMSLLHGLKLIAVAVVAQAVFGMAANLCPDRKRASIAVLAVFLVTTLGAAGQVLAILAGGLAGLVLCRSGTAAVPAPPLRFGVARRVGITALAAFLALFVLLPFVSAWSGSSSASLFDAFYRAGSLVFGGGHVVLPVLEARVVPPGWVTRADFLAGYGVAQAVPGPLFTFAAFLGTVARTPAGGVLGAAIALVAIFLPGFLLLIAALPFWDALRASDAARSAMRGANAAVVGVLAAALYDPVWTSAVLRPLDFAVALAGFVLLTAWRAPPWSVVLLIGAVSVAPSFW